MFFGMTAWLFIRKGGRLSFIVASLMILLGLQCLTSLGFIINDAYLNPHYWPVITSIDIVAVPFYAVILRELVRPGSITLQIAGYNILPFFVIAVTYIITDNKMINWIMITGAVVYGIFYLIWTNINIRKFNQRLKEQYSYTENINLNWLRNILWIFFAQLSLWIVDTLLIHANMDCVYLIASIIMWMIIDYSIYKHEAVIGSLTPAIECSPEVDSGELSISDLGRRIERLFTDERLFLNPNLKLSDVAKAIGSNRTYVSAFFNKEAESTFYDYVNKYRIEYACSLLRSSTDSINMIAGQSGFNSPQSFIRVFRKIMDVTPTDFRSKLKN